MKWFRLHSEILDDPKMRDMTSDERWILIYLMAYACELDKNGKIPFSTTEIAWRLRCSETLLETCMKRYETLKIVSCNGNGFCFVNWMKRQYKSDNSTLRVKKFRMKRFNETGVKRFRNVTVTAPDTDTDTEKSKPPLYISPHLGSFSNVKLTKNEYQKLKDNFGENSANDRIEKLSSYMASKGKKYKSHYATVLVWASKEGNRGKQEDNRKSIEDFLGPVTEEDRRTR